MKISKDDSRPDLESLTRRSLLTGTTGCVLAGIGLSALATRPAGAELPSGNWGGIRKLDEGVWAVESTPLAHRDFKTICNGGIVAGRQRVLVVEAFAGRAGARWVAEAALELTGRWPTDIVVTHYHGDHTGGLTGFLRDGEKPLLHGTHATLDRLAGGDEELEARELSMMISDANFVEEGRETALDLGGREAVFHPHNGHTASDLIVELPERQLAFAGDLLWNGMIPNFVDASPMALSKTLRAMRTLGPKRFVPGHGALGEPRLLELNLELTSILEESARRSFEEGVGPAEAAARTDLRSPFGSWIAFSDNYVERAISAWHRDLGAS